jgi:hypothetical protein
MSSPHRQNVIPAPSDAKPSNTREAALQGASLAFGRPTVKPTVKPKPLSAKVHERNAAYLAANGSWAKGPSPKPAALPDPVKNAVPVTAALILPQKTQINTEDVIRDPGSRMPKTEPHEPPPARRNLSNAPTLVEHTSSVVAATLPNRTTADPRNAYARAAPNTYLKGPANIPDLPARHANGYNEHSLKLSGPHATGDPLAIVGAHLAISRNPSPRRALSQQAASTSRSQFHASSSRSNSPKKGNSSHKAPGALLNTLRKSSSSSSSDSGDHRPKWVKRHPNKHHEGDRKRWREKLTLREIRRYEGVWASNRGIHVARGGNSTVSMSDKVGDELQSLVVREIWQRSRLPTQVLEEIWDLVDTRGIGRLTRNEFIVGLWLIDQRLKGRKLPVKVSDGLWASVGGLATVGVKIRVK